MARKMNLPDLPPVDTFDVAPHRYLYDRKEPLTATWKDVVECAPYQPGDVVYHTADDGKFTRAYVHDVWPVRDYFGDLRETYRVRFETKKGQWARRLIVTHPGPVQRGYQRAGLAPDVPND